MTGKEKLETFLREQQVPFQMQRHPVAYTSQDVALSEHIPSQMMAKVAIAFADAKMIMLVLPASHRVDLTRLSAALGVQHVYLASEQEIAAAFPDCEVGAMPPFGNLYQLPVYVDRLLTEDHTIVLQAGTHTDTVSMKYADFVWSSRSSPISRTIHTRSRLGLANIPSELWRRSKHAHTVGSGRWLRARGAGVAICARAGAAAARRCASARRCVGS